MATIDLGLVKGDTGPQGPTGATGPAGADGVTPNVQAGTTTTLPAGSDATVTRREGSPDTAPIFDFGIPQGGAAENASLLNGQPGSYYLDYGNFTDVPDIPSASNEAPQPPGTAAAGTSAAYARADHVHAMQSVPQASDAAPQALGTAAAGTSDDFSRADHVHAKPALTELTGILPKANGGTGNSDGYIRTGQEYGTPGQWATAEGSYTEATGPGSHAEGTLAKAQGSYSHAEGEETVASGKASHAEGRSVTAAGDYSHAEGYRNTANKSVAYGRGSHIEGIDTVAGTAETADNTDFAAHAEGNLTTASAIFSHAEGKSTTASGTAAHAEGFYTLASGYASHAEGYYTNTNNSYAHAEGNYTVASGANSHAGGYYTKTPGSGFAMTVIGRYNVGSTGMSNATSSNGTVFEIGNGTSESSRSNAFRVATNGTVYGAGAYNSSGADYAEMFEWLDGNPDGEDRRGLFVTLDGEKIRIAGPDDAYILGVVSADPAILGDSYFGDNWHGMYLRDVFGQLLTETVHVEETVDETTGETIPAHDEERHVLNPDWDHEQSYIAREDRTEWAPVGMLGKLIVTDDGSCTVNGYCKAGANGTATAAESGYRVLARIDQTHIRALIR